jgi:hypothetical protein
MPLVKAKPIYKIEMSMFKNKPDDKTQMSMIKGKNIKYRCL